MAYTQKKHPFPVTSCGRRRTYMQDGGESPLKLDPKLPPRGKRKPKVKKEPITEHPRLGGRKTTKQNRRDNRLPERQRVESPLKCWSGYKRKPGTTEFSDGSCIKK